MAKIKSCTRILLLLTIAAVMISCGDSRNPFSNEAEKGSVRHIKAVTGAIDDEALRSADTNQADWLSYGRNYREDRYSKLDQITKDNLDQLGLAWTFELPSTRGIQATPLVVDGIMYFTGPWSVVYALDVRKGKLIWTHDPNVPREKAADMCCGVVNRGVAIYKGAVFVGTMDGRLQSLDAATGTVNWSVMTVPEDGNYSITGAPRIANGKIVIGNGGAEYSNVRGYVTAYDATTGNKVWRFYTVPGNPSEPFEHPILEEAAKTWTGEWWKQGGGGTAWDAILYDPEFNQVLIGVGNGTHWDQSIRSPDGGDNLFLSSIVAVHADTGAYQWHYQTTPGDTWDYTATQPIILADLEIDGVERKVAMQAPKNGYFYVIDRSNGELISADNFSYVNWSDGIDEKGRPIEREGMRYRDGKTHWISPSSHGAHNWFPMTYNHETGLVYIPGVKQSGPYADNLGIPYSENGALEGFEIAVSIAIKAFNEQVIDPDGWMPGARSGELIAYDPIKQERVWAIPQPGHYNGGLLSTTTGLLMQGDAEGKFSIRDVENGRVLKQFDVRSGVISSPITYLVDGEQYITLIAEWGGGQGQTYRLTEAIYPGTVFTFKLGGTASFPEKLPSDGRTLTSLKTDASPSEIGWGYYRYFTNCLGCHSLPGSRGGAIPNLAYSPDEIFDSYQSILRDGLLSEIGMPIHDWLSEKDVENIKSYVIFTAQLINEGKSSGEILGTLARYQKKALDSDLPNPATVPANTVITKPTTTGPGNALNGKRATVICQSCHTFDKGGSHGIGPNLWNIVGADIATVESFRYSPALGTIDGQWTRDRLDAYLANPRRFAQGTTMNVGVPNKTQRTDIIAYMETLRDAQEN